MGRLVDEELLPEGGELGEVAVEGGATRVWEEDGLGLATWVAETETLLFLLRLKPKDLNRELIRSM
jgi:hypothetical protein